MNSPGRGASRVARAAAASGAATCLALIGHLLGAGGAPSIEALVVVTCLLTGGFAVLSRRQRKFEEILAALLAAQVVFHIAFSLGHPNASGTRGAVPDPSQSGVLSLLASPPMAGAHLLAAAAIAALLAYGEAALWTLFQVLRGVVLAALAPAPPVQTPLWSVRPATREVTTALRGVLTAAVPHRGPPAPITI